MNRLFAIRHKPSGAFMPEPKGRCMRGGSHLEPEKDVMPRLFHSERSAKAALTQWLRGKHVADYDWDYDDYSGKEYKYQCGTNIIPQPHRKREDMEIVPVSITFKSETIYS